jgi:hypothetical protein
LINKLTFEKSCTAYKLINQQDIKTSICDITDDNFKEKSILINNIISEELTVKLKAKPQNESISCFRNSIFSKDLDIREVSSLFSSKDYMPIITDNDNVKLK